MLDTAIWRHVSLYQNKKDTITSATQHCKMRRVARYVVPNNGRSKAVTYMINFCVYQNVFNQKELTTNKFKILHVY